MINIKDNLPHNLPQSDPPAIITENGTVEKRVAALRNYLIDNALKMVFLRGSLFKVEHALRMNVPAQSRLFGRI